MDDPRKSDAAEQFWARLFPDRSWAECGGIGAVLFTLLATLIFAVVIIIRSL